MSEITPPRSSLQQLPNIEEEVPVSIKTLIALAATVLASLATPTLVQAEQEKAAVQNPLPTPAKSGRIAVNGVDYYYAVYGTGEPLLLIHGGLDSIEMFGPNLTRLAQTRQVIGVDMQGHGRTTLGHARHQSAGHG